MILGPLTCRSNPDNGSAPVNHQPREKAGRGLAGEELAKDELDLVGVAEPELVFASVGTLGASMEEVVSWLDNELPVVDYQALRRRHTGLVTPAVKAVSGAGWNPGWKEDHLGPAAR